ncbi:MAG: GPR endopeptidase [Bacilli bacterium]|nr:GPR endopeptidase [Bacilli bacterium]
MKHEIHLEKYDIRTDLAIESLENNKEGTIEKRVLEKDDVRVTDIYVDEQNSLRIGKKIGNYTTIEFADVTDSQNKEKVKKIFSKKLKELLKKAKIKKEDTALLIGLGNPSSTPDSLGPLTIDSILVTRHLFALGEVDDGFRNVCAISPGVMGTTGIETSDMILSVIDATKPDFVIAVDALASQSVTRVNKTIQMTDTGIHPGSGVGNSRKEISKEVLGIPVIAIGVPTVVDAVTIVSDTIHYMYEHYAYMKKNMENPMLKLATSPINYLKKNTRIDDQDKQTLFGMLGTLTESETKTLVFEVLSPIGYNLMVTPKEVDFVMDKLASIIAGGINEALHKKVTH